jgi:hypothetical protein
MNAWRRAAWFGFVDLCYQLPCLTDLSSEMPHCQSSEVDRLDFSGLCYHLSWLTDLSYDFCLFV